MDEISDSMMTPKVIDDVDAVDQKLDADLIRFAADRFHTALSDAVFEWIQKLDKGDLHHFYDLLMDGKVDEIKQAFYATAHSEADGADNGQNDGILSKPQRMKDMMERYDDMDRDHVNAFGDPIESAEDGMKGIFDPTMNGKVSEMVVAEDRKVDADSTRVSGDRLRAVFDDDAVEEWIDKFDDGDLHHLHDHRMDGKMNDNNEVVHTSNTTLHIDDFNTSERELRRLVDVYGLQGQCSGQRVDWVEVLLHTLPVTGDASRDRSDGPFVMIPVKQIPCYLEDDSIFKKLILKRYDAVTTFCTGRMLYEFVHNEKTTFNNLPPLMEKVLLPVCPPTKLKFYISTRDLHVIERESLEDVITYLVDTEHWIPSDLIANSKLVMWSEQDQVGEPIYHPTKAFVEDAALYKSGSIESYLKIWLMLDPDTQKWRRPRTPPGSPTKSEIPLNILPFCMVTLPAIIIYCGRFLHKKSTKYCFSVSKTLTQHGHGGGEKKDNQIKASDSNHDASTSLSKVTITMDPAALRQRRECDRGNGTDDRNVKKFNHRQFDPPRTC